MDAWPLQPSDLPLARSDSARPMAILSFRVTFLKPPELGYNDREQWSMITAEHLWFATKEFSDEWSSCECLLRAFDEPGILTFLLPEQVPKPYCSLANDGSIRF